MEIFRHYVKIWDSYTQLRRQEDFFLNKWDNEIEFLDKKWYCEPVSAEKNSQLILQSKILEMNVCRLKVNYGLKGEENGGGEVPKHA